MAYLASTSFMCKVNISGTFIVFSKALTVLLYPVLSHLTALLRAEARPLGKIKAGKKCRGDEALGKQDDRLRSMTAMTRIGMGRWSRTLSPQLLIQPRANQDNTENSG